MIRIGLTGGIGSGKSTVAGFFCAHGLRLIDADAISRELTEAHGAAIPQIQRQFGADFLTAAGALDRAKMREYVFHDAERRKCLENIIHPLVSAESARLEQQAVQDGAAALVFDIPLLVESGRWRSRLDMVIVVDCEPDTQVRRVVERSRLNADAVRSIMRQQADRPQRLAAADAVVANGGNISLTSLKTQVDRLLVHLGLSSADKLSDCFA